MLVQAAARETKGLLRFLSVKGPELLSKYIGESEAGVRKVFERAAAAAPAVIFFDEIEALAPKRGADSTGVTDRVVNQMLCYLDGVEDRGRVFVVAATGRPDMVDPALMRPGRFDKICYCGLPTEEEKLEICQILARKNSLSADGDDLVALLRELVACLPKLFTCADVNALFSSAKIEAVNQALGQKDSIAQPKMMLSHLYEALSTSKASVSPADERRYGEIFAPYCRPAKSGTPYATSGRWIVDQQGLRVKLACVNWAGAEVKVQRDPTLPMELQDTLLKANPQLRGATALEILDAVIDACASAQLLVILDNHVSDGTWCCSDVDENGLWHNSRWPTSDWLQAHLKLASRYARQPWVVGTELRNEVRASTQGTPQWGGGGPNDWHAAATQAGNAVLTVNPHLLIIVGGLGYGKDLTGVFRLPVHLKTPEKLVYSAHSYSWSYPGLPDTYEALHAQLGKDWGFIVEDERPFTAPVWVSEFGTFSDCHKDSCANWWPDFLRYLEQGDFDWAVWHADGTWSHDDLHPFHGPTNYGVLAADWQRPAADGELLAALKTIQVSGLGQLRPPPSQYG
ncbi:unnamed protein product [Durusdinium trenchii]